MHYDLVACKNFFIYPNPKSGFEPFLASRSKDPEAGDVADVRTDAIVKDLLRRGDTELNAATGLVTVSTDVRSMEHG